MYWYRLQIKWDYKRNIFLYPEAGIVLKVEIHKADTEACLYE
jgi:hypothetical protein